MKDRIVAAMVENSKQASHENGYPKRVVAAC